MKPTLVILAAGIGSRYGGLKQIDPIGPAGETILDYSVYDAIRAGFNKVVFIIRKEIENDFREVFVNKLEPHIEIELVYQELDKLPAGYAVPEGRTKPWGTGHALMMTAGKVHTPFAIINADDYYGPDAFRTLAAFFEEQQASGDQDYAMVAYELRNTLSDFGSVARGICVSDRDNWLKSVTEMTKIERVGDEIINTMPDGGIVKLEEETLVSMNFWGFTPSVYKHIDTEFIKFLDANGQTEKAEFYIPVLVDTLIKSGLEKVKVLSNPGQWFGITYKEDKPLVVEKIRALIRNGEYPESLWK